MEETKKKNLSFKQYLASMFIEDNKVSFTTVLAFFGYLLFAIGSLYLLIFNIDWAGYTTFASYTGGFGAALQFGNKFINSKYNTIAGGYEERKIAKEIPSNNCIPINPREPRSEIR